MTEGKNRKSLKIILPALLALLVIVMIVASAIGKVAVPFIQTGRIILKNIGIIEASDIPLKWESIIFYVRLPRVVLAAIVGSALAISGTVMQGMFRNPMADPGILGVSSGAGLGAVIAIALGVANASLYYLPLFASAGAIAAAFLIFMLASGGGKTATLNLILSGMAVSMFLSAVITIILTFISGDRVKQYIFWTVGSLNSSRWENIRLIIIPIVLCCIILMFFPRELNLMLLGDEEAMSSGMNVSRARKIMLVLASITTAAAVSVTGTISFVGLLVPHIVRLITGPDHRTLLPLSAVSGAIFLVACDLAGRLISPVEEINVGIVTSLLGAPYFLFLLNRARKKGTIF